MLPDSPAHANSGRSGSCKVVPKADVVCYERRSNPAALVRHPGPRATSLNAPDTVSWPNAYLLFNLMRLITASHITTWAEHKKRHCQGILPLLVRRLVSATASSIASIDFPGGDAVSDEGWEGRLTCASRSHGVPGRRTSIVLGGVAGHECGRIRRGDTRDVGSRGAAPMRRRRPWGGWGRRDRQAAGTFVDRS